MATRPSSTSGTQTVTLTVNPSPPETLVLRLRPKKKKVQWKEGTVDNEHLNRKKSKKCCIFHKEKPFDEDYSDEEDTCGGSGGCSGGGHSHGGGDHSHGGGYAVDQQS